MPSTPQSSAPSRSFHAGLAAMVLALVLASLVAVVLRAQSPLEPAADLIMDRTPVQFAIPLLLYLGGFTRPLALLGAVALSMAAGGILGLIYGVRIGLDTPSQVAVRALRSALTVVGTGIFVLLLLPSSSTAVEATEMLGYLAGLFLFTRPSREAPGRREFLLWNIRLLGGIGVLVALLYASPLVDQFRSNEAGRRLFLWRPPPPRKPGFQLAGLTPEVTPDGDFYVMDEDLLDPDLTVESWRVSIGGGVARPYSLSFADLLALPRRDRYVTQECVSNPVAGPLMSTSLFSGVPLRLLLARAQPLAESRAVLFRAPDGHEEAIPLSLALHPSVMLAYASNGTLLRREHGFPARILIPGLYGYKGIKWVEQIELTTDPAVGHWESNGWTALPEVNTMARIDLARSAPGGVLVAGIAFAGRRGIRAVQVRAGGGSWHEATLHTPPLSPFTWVQWRVIVPAHGHTRLEARAVDGLGQVQTAAVHGQKPSGATGYHSMDITV